MLTCTSVDQTTVTIKRVWLRGLLRVQHLVILHGDRLTRQGLRDGTWGAIEGDLDDLGNINCGEVVKIAFHCSPGTCRPVPGAGRHNEDRPAAYICLQMARSIVESGLCM